MSLSDQITAEEIAELEAAFPHGELTDDQYEAWLINAYNSWLVVTLTDDI